MLLCVRLIAHEGFLRLGWDFIEKVGHINQELSLIRLISLSRLSMLAYLIVRSVFIKFTLTIV